MAVGAVEFDEATKLMLVQQMQSAAVARIFGESAHRCMEVCNRDVEMALGVADFSDVTALPSTRPRALAATPA